MSSPASPSAATPTPSIIPSTGAQSTLSLDELHRYVQQQAWNRAGPVIDPPNTIDPQLLPPSSIFIGQRRLKGGRDDDTTVRLMFRCVWPPKSVSRHVIIHMKPSVPEEALAQKLCQVFEISASGGVITKTMPEFIPGHQPIPTPGRSKNSWHILPENGFKH